METRVIIDRCVASSSKSYTRTLSRAGNSNQQKMHHVSKIIYLKTKGFLAKKKQKWYNTISSRKLAPSLETVAYAIVFIYICKKNIDANKNLLNHNQEEAEFFRKNSFTYVECYPKKFAFWTFHILLILIVDIIINSKYL